MQALDYSTELIHCINRGVERRNIVMNDKDRFRFVQSLWIMNSTLPVEVREAQTAHLRTQKTNISPTANPTTHTPPPLSKTPDVGRPEFSKEGTASTEKGHPLVDIHAWCLMDNHYHLLLSERMEGGISLFLKKLNGGYAKYFNEKYAPRKGALWQGRTKKVPVEEEQHDAHIFDYIHFNPLDFLEEARMWRECVVHDSHAALTHLRAYRWSSLLDYMGIKNFPSVIARGVLEDMFPDYPARVQKLLQQYTPTQEGL
jgi:putative transposase